MNQRMPRKPIPIGDDSVKAVESGTKAGTPTGSASNDSKRLKKNVKKHVVKKAEPAKSMKEKQKKKNRRKTIRKHRTPKSQDSKPLIPRPPPSPTPPTAAPPSPPSPKVCAKTQDEYQQSQRPTVKQQQQPVKVPAKREREKVSLNNFLSKPIPSDFDTNDIPIGTEIHTKKYEYKVLKKLGAGGCGETFVVENAKTKNILCAKVEFLNKEDLRLKIEFGIYLVIDKIKRTNKSALPHLLRCLDFGEAKGKAQFLFLPLCQNSLEGYMKTGSPSLATAFELSLQVLEGIKELHSLGYIHRDLKPANIVINAKLTKAYIIDFGMSCTFCTDPAEMPASSNYDFIGTTKYAPREAHKSLPQSRKSDIESWIYVILELFVPDILPWRDCSKNEEVAKMKDLFFTNCYARRIAQAPKCFSEILPLIESINVCAAPDYEKFNGLIRKDAESRQIKLQQKFKFDSTLLDLEIELWKTGEKQSDETPNVSELKMDSEKSVLSSTKMSSLNSVTPPGTPSRTPPTTAEALQREENDNDDEQADLHRSTMKCRIIRPSAEGQAAGSDDDSDNVKRSGNQN